MWLGTDVNWVEILFMKLFKCRTILWNRAHFHGLTSTRFGSGLVGLAPISIDPKGTRQGKGTPRVPTILVPALLRFQVSRAGTKIWREHIAGCWLCKSFDDRRLSLVVASLDSSIPSQWLQKFCCAIAKSRCFCALWLSPQKAHSDHHICTCATPSNSALEYALNWKKKTFEV